MLTWRKSKPMKKALLLVLSVLLVAASPPPHWTHAQLDRLMAWMMASSDEGIAGISSKVPPLRQLIAAGDPVAVDALATSAAEELLSDHISGCCNRPLRAKWHIENGLEGINPTDAVSAALRDNKLDELFGRARPSHPVYRALQAAYATETDPERRAALAVNMDRWRWMPRQLGGRYIIVNAAAFEATLWEGQQLIGRWEVVVGKTKSPTPIFAATVTGVTINPWWEIPPAIAAESVAGLFARDPAEAARRGYVREGNRFRQRPGPSNALGRMKLVMPNAFNVYLHDTPAQSLFDRDVRAFSHGCVRVGDALGLATTLLGPHWDRSSVDALVAAGATKTISLETPIPVYVTYFTAEPDGLGGIRYFPDIYQRDDGAKAPTPDGQCGR